MRKLSITELDRMDIDHFKQAEKIPLCVMLDNVRSRHNIGAVFRTADAFRVGSLCLCGISDTPPSVEIHKTALGAEDSVEWRYFEDALQAAETLKTEGYKLVVIEQVEGSKMLQEWKPVHGEKYAVVLGNEVSGVSQKIVDICDECIEIPQFGTKHSLNVSVVAGLIIWEFSKSYISELNR